MSNSVDQRIVQMMFDNSQFEKGVSSTLESLKALDKGLELKQGAKGLDQVQKSVDGLKFDGAISQTSGFEKALGSLKSTAGGVFSSIMDAVGNMSSGIKVVTALLSTGLVGTMVSGGWRRASNINMAEFKLRGMYEAMGYKGQEAGAMVEEAMKNASDAVDGTAYALDSAVMAASNLAASGVQAGEQLEGTLRSIAGLAAMSGRDYDSVAQIVSTVAGQGKLMTMQLRQFEMSGLNVAAVLADAFGTTEEAVRDMVTDGKVSFEVFSAVMEEKFAGAAAKANETFDGSLANIRAALSRTLATFFVYGQKGMVPIFNGIRMAINGVNTALGPLLGEDGVLTKGAYKVLSKTGKALQKWAGYTDKYVKDAEGNMKKVRTWFHQEEIDKMTKFFQGIADALKTPIDVLAQILPNAVRTFMYVGGLVREVARLFGELLAPVFKAFSNVFSDNFFAVLTKWISSLVKHIYDLVSALHVGRAYSVLLEGAFTILFTAVKLVATVIGGAFTVAVRIATDVIFALAKGIEIVLDIAGTFIDMLAWAGEALVGFWTNLRRWDVAGFNKIAKTFTNIALGARYLVGVVAGNENAWKKFVQLVQSLDENTANQLITVGKAFKVFGSILSNSGEIIHNAGRTIADTIYDLIKPSIKPLRLGLSNIGDAIVDGISAIQEGLSGLVPEQIRNLGESISDFLSGFVALGEGEGVVANIQAIFDTIKNSVESSEIFQAASHKLTAFATAFQYFTESFKSRAADEITKVVVQIKNGFKEFLNFLAPVGALFKNIGEFLGVEGLTGSLSDVSVFFESLFAASNISLISNAIHSISSGLLVAGQAILFFVGAVAYLAKSAVMTVFEKLKELGSRLAPLLSLVGEAFQTFGQAVSDAFNEFSATFTDGSFGIDAVRGFIDKVLDAFSNLGTDLGNLLPKIGDTIWNFFRENFLNLGDKLNEVAKSLGSKAFTALTEFVSGLGILDRVKGTALEGPLNALKDFFTTVVPEKASKVVDAVTGFISFMSSTVVPFADAALKTITSGASSLFSFLSGIGEHFVLLKDVVLGAFKGLTAVKKPFEDFFTGVGNSLEWFRFTLENGGNLADAFKTLIDGFKNNFGQLTERIAPTISRFGWTIRSVLNKTFENVTKDFGSFIGEMLGKVPKAIGAALEGLDSLGIFDSLKNAGFEKPLRALQDFFNTVAPSKIKEIATGISGFLAPALGGLMDFGGKVARIFEEADFAGSLNTFGSSVADALKTFFDAIDGQDISVEAVKKLAHSIADSFGQLLSESFSNVLSVGGQLFGAITSTIGGPFEKIVSFGGKAFEVVSGFVKGFLEVLKSFDPTGILQNFDLSKPLASLKDFISGLLDIDVSKLSGLNGVIETIKGIIRKIVELVTGKDDGFDFGLLKNESGSIYKRLFDKYFGDTDGLDGSVKSVGERIKTIFDGFKKFVNDPIGTIFDVLADAVNTFASRYDEFKSKLDTDKLQTFIDDVAKLAKNAGGLVVLWEVVQMFENVGHFAASMARMADSFRVLAFELKQLSQDARRFIRTQAILNVAIALGILVAAFALLVHVISVSDSGDLLAGLTLISVLLIELVGIMVIISYVKYDETKVAKLCSMLTTFAITVAAMGLIAAALGTLDQGQLTQGLGALTLIMVLMTMLVAVTALVPENFGKMKGTFLSIAATLLVITVVVQILGTMDSQVLARGGALLIGLMVLLGILAATVQYFSKGTAAGSKALIEIAASILILSAAIGVLAMIPSSRLDEAVFEVIGLIAVMTGALIALTRFTKTSDLKGAGKALIGFAAAIVVVSAAVGMLAFVSAFGGDLFAGMASVMVLIGAMSLAIFAISLMGPKSIIAAKAIKAFGTAIGILAVAVVALSLLPSEKVVPALLGLCAAIVLFAASLSILTLVAGKFPKGAGLIIGMFVAIGAMALMVAGAIAWLAKSVEQSPAIAQAIGILVTGLVVFAAVLGVLIAVAGTFKVGAILVIGILLAIGATSLMFATAMDTMADALAKLAVIGPAFAKSIVTSLKALGEGLWEARDSMAKGIAGIGSALIAGILMIIPEAVRLFGSFMLELVGVLIEFAPAMGEAAVVLIGGLVEGIATGIDEHGGDVLNAVLHLFDVVIAGIQDVFTGALTEFGNWLADITGFAAAAEAEAAQSAGDASKAASESAKENNTVAEDTQEELTEAKKVWESETPGLAALAEKYGGAAVSGIQSSASGFNFMEALHLDGASMDISLSELSEKAKEMGIALPENITAMVENGLGDRSLSSIMDDQGFLDIDAATAMANEAGLTVGADGWGAGLEQGIQEYKLDGLLAGTGVVDLAAITSQFTEAGSTASTSFSQGFSDGLNVDGSGPVKKAAEAMKMEKEFTNSGTIDGKAAVSGIETGLKNFALKAKNATTAAKKEIENAKSGLKTAGSKTGSGIVEGLISGMNSQLPSLRTKVNEICELAEKAAKAKLKINSPSKVFAEIGSGVVEGMILGMSQMRGSLKSATEETAGLSISTAANQMSYLSGLLEDIDEQPVIRPVLDLTDYNAGLAQMRSLDTYSSMIGAQIAMRGLSLQRQGELLPAASKNTNINVYLNYDASADANQIVMDIADGLEARLAMEGV